MKYKLDGSVICFGCSKAIEPLNDETYKSTCTCCRHEKDVDASEVMVDDGLVEHISAGYGSRHDTQQFLLALCDDCIELAIRERRLLDYKQDKIDFYDTALGNISKKASAEAKEEIHEIFLNPTVSNQKKRDKWNIKFSNFIKSLQKKK